uniref:Peptidase C14 caspase domain-containing protein n=1 Tax=Psilocybe cubensis TaxID=181762 RepID=A0A8H7XZF3_PSICU
MPLFKTLSPFGSFAFDPSPWFSHLFSNLVQHFRQLKAYRFLSQSILFLEIASAFRRPTFRLLKSVYYAPHDSLEYIDGGSALGEEISAVECVEVDDLKDHTKPVVQSPLAAAFVANVGGDAPDINNNMTVGDSRERLSDVSMSETHLHVQSIVDMSSIRESQVTAKIRRRALLIGVGNNLRREDLNDLPSTNDLPPTNEYSCREHRDVEDMRSLLEDMYGYDPNEIVSLLDDNKEGSIHPTRENIVRQIQILVEGAKQNDHFFFYFVGHSFQEDTDDEEEEDRKNEFILTADGEEIMDNFSYRFRRFLTPVTPAHSSVVFDAPEISD